MKIQISNYKKTLKSTLAVLSISALSACSADSLISALSGVAEDFATKNTDKVQSFIQTLNGESTTGTEPGNIQVQMRNSERNKIDDAPDARNNPIFGKMHGVEQADDIASSIPEDSSGFFTGFTDNALADNSVYDYINSEITTPDDLYRIGSATGKEAKAKFSKVPRHGDTGEMHDDTGENTGDTGENTGDTGASADDLIQQVELQAMYVENAKQTVDRVIYFEKTFAADAQASKLGNRLLIDDYGDKLLNPLTGEPVDPLTGEPVDEGGIVPWGLVDSDAANEELSDIPENNAGDTVNLDNTRQKAVLRDYVTHAAWRQPLNKEVFGINDEEYSALLTKYGLTG